MNLRLIALRAWVPPSIREEGLQELIQLAEDAFGVPAPDTGRLSYQDALRAFAEYTRDRAREAAATDVEFLKQRLFDGAHRLGAELRERLRIKTGGEAIEAARILYRSIGIDFRGQESGDVVIRKCYFSAFYTEHACRIMSSVDEGLIAGLSGGARLSFSRRITEGGSCCLAAIEFEAQKQ